VAVVVAVTEAAQHHQEIPSVALVVRV
jgi:hypothetical protein